MKQKRAVLITVGQTPAVVTETVYALHQRDLSSGAEHPETVVRVFTTSAGRLNVVSELITDGVFDRMRDELALDYVGPLTEDHVIALGGLSDVRSEDDVLAMADMLCESVAEWTADDSFQVHASIAGGRKPMSMQMGFAMTILGRRGDELSHVLTDPDLPDTQCQNRFYYPSKINGGSRDVTVQLINVRIPLLGRKTLPMLGQSRDSYTDIVNVMQSVVAPTIHICLESGSFYANDTKINLGPRDLALYAWFCLRYMNGESIRSPYISEHVVGKLCDEGRQRIGGIDHLLEQLQPEVLAAAQIVQIYDDLPRSRTRLKYLYPFAMTQRELGISHIPCMTGQGWSESLSRIKSKIVMSLGSEEMAKPLCPVQNPDRNYEMGIASENITIAWPDGGDGNEILNLAIDNSRGSE